MLRHRCTFTLLAAALACGQASAQAPILKTNSPVLKINTAAAAATASLDPHAGETKAERDARMAWWRAAKFGLFIHWGLYAVPAGTWDGKRIDNLGEWIMNTAKIPVKDYAALAPQFDPTQFDAETWVSIAQAAGMKYIVITAKHHDGFAMFHSKTDPFNIYDATPFKRDPVAELAAACKKHGLKFGVYYSQAQDWHHPGGAAYGGSHWDPTQDGDLHAYVKNIAAPQVRELMAYHPAILWWDTPVDMSHEDIALLTAPLALDPGLIFNNRLGNGIPGDTETPEQNIPAQGFPGKDWETCMTLNDTWGYKSYDTNFKPTSVLLHNLIDIASKGGNYLLNVGPDATGTIPAPEVQRLREVGTWMGVNGASIYATTHSPYKHLPFDGRATVKGNTLYLNVFVWPTSGLTLKGLQTRVRSAKVLSTGETLKVTKTADGMLTISKPASLDTVSTAIALALAGPPVVSELDAAIASSLDGRFTLKAEDATLVGNGPMVEGSGETADIGYWSDPLATAAWKVMVPAASSGRYRATLEYSCDPGSGGSTFAVLVDGAPSGLSGTIVKTLAWSDYQTMTLDGTLTLTEGTHDILLKTLTMPNGYVMNLRRITLTPSAVL